MILDPPDDANVLTIRDRQISPGCPTADAVLDGYSGRPKFWIPTPPISHRTNFGHIFPPERPRNLLTFLHHGSFVVFELDKQELAVQLGVPEDSEALRRCLEFPTKRYVGLVLGSFGGSCDPDVQPYEIAFVSQSLPPGLEGGTEKGSFAIPIFPTKPEDTNSRTPLRPKLFPWTGCYQYTILGVKITPTHTYPSAIEYRLGDEDLHAFEVNCSTDWQTRDISFSSIEEKFLFESMRMSANSTPLPVKVWQELEAGEVCHDPREFVEEVLQFVDLALSDLEDQLWIED